MSMYLNFDDIQRQISVKSHIFFLVLPSNPSLNQMNFSSHIRTPGTWLSLDGTISLQQEYVFFSTLDPKTRITY